jgi:hypothetical protein
MSSTNLTEDSRSLGQDLNRGYAEHEHLTETFSGIFRIRRFSGMYAHYSPGSMPKLQRPADNLAVGNTSHPCSYLSRVTESYGAHVLVSEC